MDCPLGIRVEKGPKGEGGGGERRSIVGYALARLGWAGAGAGAGTRLVTPGGGGEEKADLARGYLPEYAA